MKENFKHGGETEQLSQGESDWLVAVAQRSRRKGNLSSGRVTQPPWITDLLHLFPWMSSTVTAWEVAQWNWWGTRYRDPQIASISSLA